MNRISIYALAALGTALVASSAPAAVTVVDVSALDGGGTIVSLAAGSYTVKIIDSSEGGAYDGYSAWSNNSGCDGSGMNCSQGFLDSIAIDFGHGTGTFDRQDGYQYGQLVEPGDNHIYATGAQAIAQFQTASLVRAPIPTATDTSTYSATSNPISFTLASAQQVNFFVFDNPYSDNRGGVSLQLTTPDAVPEPASWAMTIGGVGFAGGVMRRRRRVATMAVRA